MASVAKTFKVKNGLDVVGGKSTAAASTTSYASLNLPPGTAPTSPANGDMWSTSAGLYVHINGTTVGPLGVSTWGQITGTLSNQTDLQNALNLKANLASPTFTGTVTLPVLVGSDTTDASSSTTGAFKTAGGMGIAKKLYVGTDLSVGGNVTSGTWQGSIVSPTYGGTGVNNGTKTITLGGNLTTSGAFNTTLTVTANTSVTLPTSGTLVNTAVATLDSLTNIDTTNTATHTLNIGTGQTASAATKTVQLGSGGLSGSTTAINIGSSTSGATSTISLFGSVYIRPSNTANTTVLGSSNTGASTSVSLFDGSHDVITLGDLTRLVAIGAGSASATSEVCLDARTISGTQATEIVSLPAAYSFNFGSYTEGDGSGNATANILTTTDSTVNRTINIGTGGQDTTWTTITLGTNVLGASSVIRLYGTIEGGSSVSLFDTVTTTATAFHAATSLSLGASSGTATIRNATVTLSNATALNINGASPAIATTSTTASVFNSTVTTLNIGGAATAISLGAGTGTTTVNNNLTVTGNLTVNGTVSTINSTTITVDDKNIELGSTASPSDTTADGGGITLKGSTDKTFNWVDATDSWTSSEHLDLASGKVLKINGTQVLSASQYTGNAATATTATTAAAWSTSRTITLGGDLSGSVSLDGSANVTLTATVAANSVALGTDTTGNYIATIAGTTDQVTVTGSGSETAAVTLSLPQSIATTSSPTFASVKTSTLVEESADSVTANTNNTAHTIDTFTVATYSTAEYLIQMKQGTKMTTTHLTVSWDGTDCLYQEWGTMDAAAGAVNATLSASVTSGTCTVVATTGGDASTTNVVIKAKTTYIAA